MHCGYCLRASDNGGPICGPCGYYLGFLAFEAPEYEARLSATARVQLEIRLVGGIKPWIAWQRQQHRAMFPHTAEFLKASDRDVRVFTERLRLVGGPLVARP